MFRVLNLAFIMSLAKTLKLVVTDIVTKVYTKCVHTFSLFSLSFCLFLCTAQLQSSTQQLQELLVMLRREETDLIKQQQK